ncbi:MAG: hypothetical protein GY754_12520 [bacterium]|nr:hypothetical protein [bacterium]
MSTVPIIRGGNPLYDRYYIDDIPVDFPYHYVGSIVPLFSSINENIIDKASVIKGTAPLNYDDTLGNIIHIKTKDPDEAGVHGKIQLDPVVPVLPSVYVTAVPLEDLSVTFAGRRSYADLVTDLDDVEVSFQDHYLKVSYNLFDNHRIYFISFGVDDYQAYKNFSARNTYTVWALKWEYLITKKYFLKTIISRYSTEQYFENTNIYQGMAGAYLKFNPLQYRIYQEFNAVVKNFYLKTGYEFLLHDNGVEGNITLSDLPDLDLLDNTGNSLTVRYPVEGKTISLFSEMGADFDPFWANLGVKFKYYGPLSNSSFSMRAMCGVNINNKNTVYGGGGLYHAHPDVYYYLGETEPGFNDSKAYNAVLGYKSEFLPNLTGQLELYYSSYKDLASVNIGMINNSEYKKITQFNPFSGEKEGTSYGAELSVKGNIKDFYGWVSYAFSVSKRSNDDNNLEDFYSDFDQTHLFKIAAAAKFGNWTPSVLLHLYSSLPYTPVTGATQNGSSYSPTYGDYNSERFPLHFRIDAKVTYTTEGNSRFYVEVWNVLYTQSNYLYQDFNSGSPYSNENPENKADLLPIFVWIGMELCF